MVLEWRLAYSRIDLSLLQRQSASQEKHGRLQTFSSISLLDLKTRDRRLCIRLVLVSFIRHSTICYI